MYLLETTLFMLPQVEQLDDTMIFYFASRSSGLYQLAELVFHKFQDAKLRGQKVQEGSSL